MKRILVFSLALISLSSLAQDRLGSFQAVEQMPYWATCSDADMNQLRTCTVDEIQMHLILNMDLTDTELESIRGQMLMIRFVVDNKGNVKKPEIIGGRGEAGEKALLKAVDDLPPMNPGMQDGKPVDVLYVIPFRVNS